MYESNYVLRHILCIVFSRSFNIFIHQHVCHGSSHMKGLRFVKSATDKPKTWEEGKRRCFFLNSFSTCNDFIHYHKSHRKQQQQKHKSKQTKNTTTKKKQNTKTKTHQNHKTNKQKKPTTICRRIQYMIDNEMCAFGTNVVTTKKTTIGRYSWVPSR